VDDEIERAWAELEADWGDDTKHARLVALADAADRLPMLAKRYRAVKEAGGERSSRAEKALETITTRALGRMSATPREEVPKRSRAEWIALGVSVVLGTAALWQMLRVM
jgi:hypothetical protein